MLYGEMRFIKRVVGFITSAVTFVAFSYGSNIDEAICPLNTIRKSYIEVMHQSQHHIEYTSYNLERMNASAVTTLGEEGLSRRLKKASSFECKSKITDQYLKYIKSQVLEEDHLASEKAKSVHLQSQCNSSKYQDILKKYPLQQVSWLHALTLLTFYKYWKLVTRLVLPI
jgi:hypothetical protein